MIYLSPSNTMISRGQAMERLERLYGAKAAAGRLLAFEGMAERYGAYSCEFAGVLHLTVQRPPSHTEIEDTLDTLFQEA